MKLLCALFPNLIGLGALCLGMPKHYRQCFGRLPPLSRSRMLRALGWALLALSLGCAVQSSGWQVGLLEWIGLASVCGLALVFTLPFIAPHGDAAGAPLPRRRPNS